jgi:acetyl-CoA carboxylase biotin carboxyl carrier protein
MNSKNIFNENHVKKLANILNDSNLTEIEYENNGIRIRLYKSSRLNLTQDIHKENMAPDRTEKNMTDFSSVIKSPMVGIIYRAPNPEAPDFIKIGEKVTHGQTLLIIEAMKIMTPLKSPKSGTIKKILVHNAEPVEFDQPLLVLE